MESTEKKYVYEIFVCETDAVEAVCEDNIDMARLAMLVIGSANKGRGVSCRRVEGDMDDEKYSEFKFGTKD